MNLNLAMPVCVVCVCLCVCVFVWAHMSVHFDCGCCSTNCLSLSSDGGACLCVSEPVSTEMLRQQTAPRVNLMTNVFTEEKLMIFPAGVNGHVNTQK